MNGEVLATLDARSPVMGVCRNPVRGLHSSDMRIVGVGVSIAELAAGAKAQGQLICRLNGVWLSRLTVQQLELVAAAREARVFDANGKVPPDDEADRMFRRFAAEQLNWRQTLTLPGDVIEFHDQPGRETVRVLLTVAILVASIYYPGAVKFLVLLNVAYNLLVPPKQGRVDQGQQAGNVYSAALNGNQARLDQPIWKICGRVKLTPPFAAQPYLEYVPHDLASPTVDCDQDYFALFALGLGNYTLEKAFIAKTSIAHFADVTTAQMLAPGDQPSVVLANVVTSLEVSQLELDQGQYVGGYAASRPGDAVVSIGVDVAAQQGLGVGVSGTITVEWQVEVREINQYGAPMAEWQVVGAESRTASTNTPQRWSNRYTLATPIRCEVRLARTSEKNTSADARDSIQWVGLRAYLSKPAPLNADTTHYEVAMRASEQLSADSAHDFSMIVRGLVRTWSPGGGWGPEVFSRNAAWWLADCLTSTVWGLGLPDERVDLQGIYELSLTCDARQDHFDYVFSESKDAWEAAQLIARSCRSRVFKKNAVWTVARDELVDLPVTAFTSRNTEPKSMVLHAALPGREAADGIVVEYLDNVIWDTVSIECPCPGFSVSDPDDPRFDAGLPAMSRPTYITLEGVTGAKHAEREGLYQAASLALRTTTVSATVEMEGLTVSYMDLVRWQPQIAGYGQTGDVAFWDEASLVMGLTEPPDFSVGTLYLTLRRDDGSLTTPVAVMPGPTAWDVTLPAAPDFDLILDDGGRERPMFILGTLDDCDELAKIAVIGDGGKTDQGAQLFEITSVIDDERVHTADNALLPGPGDIQDPIDGGLDFDDAGGGLVLLHLTDHTLIGITSIGDVIAGLRLSTVGAAQGEVTEGGSPASGSPFVYATQWTSSPIEPAAAALYEVRATVTFTSNGTGLDGSGDPAGVWLNLGTERVFNVTVVAATSPGLNQWGIAIELRRVGTTIVQQRRTLTVLITDVP